MSMELQQMAQFLQKKPHTKLKVVRIAGSYYHLCMSSNPDPNYGHLAKLGGTETLFKDVKGGLLPSYKKTTKENSDLTCVD